MHGQVWIFWDNKNIKVVSGIGCREVEETYENAAVVKLTWSICRKTSSPKAAMTTAATCEGPQTVWTVWKMRENVMAKTEAYLRPG
mgnify:CR=1 FL=1